LGEFLLVIHVLSAAAWVGGGFLGAFLGPRLARAGTEASLGWARALDAAGTRYFNPVAILTALTGVGLVLSSDEYDWADAFVSVGLGVVVATAVIAMAVHAPGGRKLIAAIEAGDRDGAAAEGKRAAIWGAISTVLLIVATITMVLKSGTG